MSWPSSLPGVTQLHVAEWGQEGLAWCPPCLTTLDALSLHCCGTSLKGFTALALGWPYFGTCVSPPIML